MKQEIKNKWIDALRSGDYLRSVEELKYPHERCVSVEGKLGTFTALGVLADIYARENKLSWEKEAVSSCVWPLYTLKISESEKCRYSLGKTIREWAQISSLEERKIHDLNDDVGFSFPETADHIRNKL